MPEGLIIKGIGGFYYVKVEDNVIECRARGKFRNEGVTPLVGDYVNISIVGNTGAIESIMPRRSELIRPSVANIDQAVITFAAAKPDINFNLLDKFLILTEYNNLDVIICINKTDLSDVSVIEKIMIPYEMAGYYIIYTSTKNGYGINQLKSKLKNRISVFAGPSGVGKSSLLNIVNPHVNAKTGEVSERIGRGRHTTRHSELLELKDGGYIVDTPGFTSLSIDFLKKEELFKYYPELRNYSGCRFNGCSHVNEPGCKVKEALSLGNISSLRYESYVSIYNELNKQRRNYK